jgi:hypothetical protein
MRILLEPGLWEEDYLLNEILPKGDKTYDPVGEADVFAFCSRNHTYKEIISIVQKTKPKIIICLSDEFIGEDLSHFNELGDYCKLFLRNYHHPNYNYTPNTLHIPLGYTNGCKVFEESKQLNWTFFGEIKTDRQEMINEFRVIPRHFVGKTTSKELMSKTYSKSIFVPCGRGNSSLDCFRLYEASMNGAIPVVVGSKEEIECTFKYEENPPWIFAETWNDAAKKCNILLSSSIDNSTLLNWWNNRIKNLRSRVSEVLDIPPKIL